MTNINCTLNCIYQNDGKCCYEQIDICTLAKESDCAYFKKAENSPNTGKK